MNKVKEVTSSLGQTFASLMAQSVITSGVIATLLVGTACYCAVMQIPLPDVISGVLGVVVGYFFSAKASAGARGMTGARSVQSAHSQPNPRRLKGQ